GRIGRLLPITPMAAVGAGYGSAVAVFGSAAIGAPVSMSQSTASALVGAESVVGSYRRVRWQEAMRIVSTWLTTFPTALALAALLGLATRR
ncbi:MAG TPA: inorganic phosphate transporter, partial [Candidatus Limnocylindrales bacterium]